MTRDVKLEAVYPQPPDAVWKAIATREALSTWLMPTDFEPKAGHRFQFRTKPNPGFNGIVDCEIVAFEPAKKLSMTWSSQDPVPTVVTFELVPEGAGTRLRFTHAGFRGIGGLLVSFILGSGWKKMLLRKMPVLLGRIASKGWDAGLAEYRADPAMGCDHTPRFPANAPAAKA